MNRTWGRLCVVMPWALVSAVTAADIVLETAMLEGPPGGTVTARFLIQNQTTPVLGYSLDIEVTPLAGAGGMVTVDVAQTNLFPARNLISAAGGTLNAQLTGISDVGEGNASITAIVDDGVPVVATDGVNDVLAEVVFNLSVDAIGEFAIELGSATALSDAAGFPIAFTADTGLIGVVCKSVQDCADSDFNGIRDDGCVWVECDAGACNAIDIPFGDMGGQFGACEPDGTPDNNDFLIALNCFANVDIGGNAGAFPCEDNPPQAYNVDTGGRFGDCDPDGVCDGNDAFAALNAFSGSSSCACPLDGPAPAFNSKPATVDRVGITLAGGTKRLAPEGLIDVDIYLDRPIRDLRGYQLHVAASGGRSGYLKLVDMHVDLESPAFALGDQAVSTAFNVATGQLFVGMQGDGMTTSAAGYLATVTFQASADAAGKFAIDILHDPGASDQRTFLFPTPANGRIDVVHVAPAMVSVSGQRTRK